MTELITAWRERSVDHDRHGNVGAARTYELVADELEASLRGKDEEIVTLAVAAQESGFSEDHLGRLVREGRIPNAGRKGSPRVRRGDVPKKPQAGSAAVATRRSNDDVVGRLFRDIAHSKAGD